MLDNAKIWVYHSVVDLRKSYHSLQQVVEAELEKDPSNGDSYVFINRSKTLAKVLWWDRTGWCLLLKKLSAGKFRVSGNGQLRIINNQRRFFDGF